MGRKDGRVEAVFEGDEEKTDKMIELCQKDPRVSNVEVIWEELSHLQAFSLQQHRAARSSIFSLSHILQS